MDKNLIIKYINKTASQEEIQKVLEWASISKENETLLVEMMNRWVADHMPHTEADDTKYDEFRHYLNGYNSSAAQNRRSGRLSSYAWISAAAIIVLLVAWNIFLMQRMGNQANIKLAEQNMIESVPANHIRTIYTEKGVKAKIMLPDSSSVWLNSDTKIEYPELFNTQTREVRLSGEAYFEVKADSLHPMIITTGKGFKVKVTGTAFNIKAYEDDETAKTTLYSGSISLLYRGNGNKLIEKTLQPYQSVDLSDKKISINNNATEEQMENASIWKVGKIHFESTPISEVIKILNRWHGTQFTVTDQDILKYRITANFENESIVQILELIKMTTFIDYSISGKNITLTKR